jgi:hypothetical protein
MYFYLKNLKSSKIITCDNISEIESKKPSFDNKPEFKDWQGKPSTEHVFYSLNAGDSPKERISKHNPLREVYGIVIDYDAPIEWDVVEETINSSCKGNPPTYITRTFSGYIRTVYEFKEPIIVDPQLYPAFIKELGIRLNVERMFNGFDDASYIASQYFELGEDWKIIGEPLAPTVIMPAWIKAAGRAEYVGTDASIPLEAVHEAIQEKYGNRWVGEFTVGARGPLVWVDDGIDREGCMVKENGFWVFSTRSGGQGFKSWEELLGKDFVQKYEEKKYGALLDSYWFDGNTYYCLDEDNCVVNQKESVLRLDLRYKGFSTSKRGKVMSELETAEHFIAKKSRVHLVAPVPSRKERIVYFQSNKILNTDNLQVMEPASERNPKKCEWITNFLEQFFADGIDYFFAWWKRAYIAARDKKPLQGQCLIIVGGTGKGKSLLSNRIIGGSMGGFADASSYVSGATTFNKELGSKLCWVVDDNTSAANPQDQRKATEINKRIVANPRCEYIAKCKDAVTVPWNGRIVITTNLDAHSLTVIPALDSGNEDKIMAFLVHPDATNEFPPNHELEALIEEELPYLLAELLHGYHIPERLKGTERYGVKGFINKVVREAAYDNSSRSTVGELIDFFATRRRAAEGEQCSGSWAGTLTEFQAAVMALNENRHIGISGNLEQLRRSFHSYEDVCKFNKKMRPVISRGTGSGKRWTIDLDERFDLENGLEEPF